MRWSLLAALSLLAVCVAASGPRLANAQDGGEATLEVAGATSYHLPAGDGGGLYYVVAEVQNRGESPAGEIVVRMATYRADGSVAGETRGYPYLPQLAPGERAPVALLIAEERAGDIARHELSVSGRATSARPFVPALRQLGADRIWDSPLGQRFLIGELVNVGPQTLADVTLVVGFYHADGRILHVARVPVLIQPIGPEQRAPFRVEAPGDAEVASWRFWYVARPAAGYPVPLNVRVAAAEPDDYGRVVVSAIVTNLSSAPARDLRAVALLRDAQGRIVNVGTWESAPGLDVIDGRAEATLRLLVDAQPAFASVEVRATSSTALLLSPESHGIFFPIVGKADTPQAED